MKSRCIWFALGAFLASQTTYAGDLEKQVRSGHNLLEDGRVVNVGQPLGKLTFSSVDGQAVYLDQVTKQGPAAFVFLSTKCPLAKRYTMRLRRIHQELCDDGVQLFAVFPNSDETDEGIKQFLEQTKFPFPCVRDINGYLVRRFDATMTPQAFVVDENSVIRYRGAIDDHRYENRVKHQYLRDALLALVSGRTIETPTTKAMGCSIHLDTVANEGAITYSGHIARILQDNCQNCHRDGQVAPFALTNYEEARTWMTEIGAYTESRLMPPWKAAAGVAHYTNDISLTDQEIEVIQRWVDAGAPLGNEQEIPPSPKFNDGWMLGEPDLIFEMPEEYVIGPEGEDDYRHFVIPHEAIGDRFVEAVDVQPGNRSVVHHVLAYADTSGKARELDEAAEGPGYTRFGDVGFKPASLIGGWAPGSRPTPTPKGTGRWLPKQCDVVLQVHYYRTGVEERDRTKIGLYFSKAERPVATRVGVVINRDFEIPADETEVQVKAHLTIKEPSYLYSVAPHMHLIGETMQVVAHRPDGSVLPIVRIDDWDFNWQGSYHFKDLHKLPKGTEVKLVATFNNSEDNPNNPNSPPETITWGEKTTDEMCIAFLGLIRESEYDPIRGARLDTSGQ